VCRVKYPDVVHVILEDGGSVPNYWGSVRRDTESLRIKTDVDKNITLDEN